MESKEFWYLDALGYAHKATRETMGSNFTDRLIEMGNRFPTELDAKLASEKIRAYARLKDCGFEVDGWMSLAELEDLGVENDLPMQNVIGFTMSVWDGNLKDLDLLFSDNNS